MLEWLKTPSGAYNLTFIIAIVGWIVAGFGIFAGFHLNKVRAVQAQPRTLTREQREAFITAAANAPKGSVRVLALVSDPEAYAHAKELTGLFRTGGYNSIFVPLNNPDYMAPGIRLTVSVMTPTSPFIDGLEQAMKAARIPVVRDVESLAGGGDVIVGPKP